MRLNVSWSGGLFLCLVFVCLTLFTGCEEIEEEKPWIQVERPDMLFTDTTLMDSYDKGVLAWKLKTAYLERWGDKDIVFVRPVLVDIYDSLGERTAFLRADSGRLDMKFTYVYAYGHVYALTPKGASVRSDSLLWNKKDNQVRTDSYVRVVSEDGDVLQGKGFVSDAQLDNWRILSNVTGIFQDAAKRLKDEDQKQAEEIENRNRAASVPPKPAPKPEPPAKNTISAKPSPQVNQGTPGKNSSDSKASENSGLLKNKFSDKLKGTDKPAAEKPKSVKKSDDGEGSLSIHKIKSRMKRAGAKKREE